MAIIITANQIYDISEYNIIKDNNISGLDGEEGTYETYTTTIYSRDNINYRQENDHGAYVSPSWNLSMSFPQLYRRRYSLTTKTRTLNLHVVSEEPIDYDTLYVGMTITTKGNIMGEDLYGENISIREGNPIYTLSSVPLADGNGDEVFTDEDLASYVKAQMSNSAKYGYTISNEEDYAFDIKIEYLYSITSKYERQASKGSDEGGGWGESEYLNTECNAQITNFTFYIRHLVDNVKTDAFSYGTPPNFTLENNELLQVDTIIDNKKLSQYNYEQITAEWSEGKELATIKCSIGEYYEYDESAQNHKGALAISTQNNDLPMIFNIGDLVIPYIAVANGQTEPLSLKLNGTPKVFKVTQIRPYFDGAFWQELTLQEHTK